MKWEEFEQDIREYIDDAGVSLDDIDVEVLDCDSDSYGGKSYHSYTILISYEDEEVKKEEEEERKYQDELAKLNKKYGK